MASVSTQGGSALVPARRSIAKPTQPPGSARHSPSGTWRSIVVRCDRQAGSVNSRGRRRLPARHRSRRGTSCSSRVRSAAFHNSPCGSRRSISCSRSHSRRSPARTSSILTGVVGSSLVMTSSQARGNFSVCLVADDDRKARPRMQRGRERVVDQLPVAILAFERDARDVQLAVAHVADRDRSLLLAACRHFAEEGRAGHDQLARRRVAGYRHRCGPPGSLLSTVRWAPGGVGPKTVGWNRIGKTTDVPAATAIG